MRKARGIDELYEEAKHYDIVLTNDAALATALNGRVDTPRVGGFAYTPRQIAATECVRIIGEGLWNDIRIISAISEETGYGFKHIHGELENIRNIRKYTPRVSDYLYSKASKSIYESFKPLPTIEKVIGRFRGDGSKDPKDDIFFKDKKVAMIGIELFNDLDKTFSSPYFDEIEIFEPDEEYSIKTIYSIGNDRELAENVVDLIDIDTATDTAVVMDTSGPIADAVRAALYRRKIPFKNTLAVRDLSQIRDYLQFISLSLSYDTVRVKHVREMFSSYGGNLKINKDKYLLNKIMDSLEDRNLFLGETMKNIRSLTFNEVCERIVHPKQTPQIKILLEDMGISDLKITSKLANEVLYAVNNVGDLRHNEVIPEEEKKGVLLADCHRSVFVDRPLTIFVGIGPEWGTTIIGKDYIDRQAEADINAAKFTVLVQQGTSRVYAVNSMRGGKESRPCSVFDQIFEESGNPRKIESFADVCDTLIQGPWYIENEVEYSKKGESAIDSVPVYDWRFSKTKFNRYFECPRSFMFDSFLPSTESDKTAFGSIIHEFAEFYLCYPDLVKNSGTQHYSRIIEKRYSGLSCEQMKELDSSKIETCMENIIRLFDTLKIGPVPLDLECARRKRPNMFMEMHGCEMYSSLAETQYTSGEYPVFGNFDLLVGNSIIDYKTGAPIDVAGIAKKMDPEAKCEHYEFQPLIYLALLRSSGVAYPMSFDAFYVADNEVEAAGSDDFDITKNIRHVSLREENRYDLYLSPDSVAKDFFSKFVIERWNGFVSAINEYGPNRIIQSYPDEELILSCLKNMKVNDNKTNRKAVSAGIAKMAKLLRNGVFCQESTAYVPSDVLDGFLDIMCNAHKTASLEYLKDFPASPRINCEKCNFYQVCTRDKVDLRSEDEQEGSYE